MKVRTGSNQRKLLSPFVIQLLFILFFVEFVKGALIVTILPVYMKSVLGLSAFSIGISLSMAYIGDNLFRSPTGWVIDRIGYRYTMVVALIIAYISVIMMAFSGSKAWIIVASGLLGVGTSPLWPCVISGATEMVGDQARGTVMSVIYIAWLSGAGLGPIVINLFVDQTYVSAFRLMFLLMAAVILIALFLPGRGKSKPSTQEQSLPFKAQQHSETVPSRLRKWRDWSHDITAYFRQIRSSLHISKWLFPAMFMQNFSIGLLIPVMTLYTTKILNLTPHQYSLLLLIGGTVTIAFLFPIGKLVDKWGTRWVLHIAFPFTAAALLIFTFVRQGPALFALVIMLGVGYAMIIPSWNALIAGAIPKQERGAIWGFFLTVEGAGLIVGPVLSGKLWDEWGYHAPFVASGIVLALLFLIHLRLQGYHGKPPNSAA